MFLSRAFKRALRYRGREQREVRHLVIENKSQVFGMREEMIWMKRDEKLETNEARNAMHDVKWIKMIQLSSIRINGEPIL